MQSKLNIRKTSYLALSVAALIGVTASAQAQVRLGWVRNTGTNPTLAITRSSAGDVYTFGNGTVNKYSKLGVLLFSKSIASFTYSTTLVNNVVSLHAGLDGGVYLVERQGPTYSSTKVTYCTNNGTIGFTQTFTGHTSNSFNATFPVATSDALGNLFFTAQTAAETVRVWKVTPSNVVSAADTTVTPLELGVSDVFTSSLIVPDNAGGLALLVDHSDGKGHVVARFNTSLGNTQRVNTTSSLYQRWAQGANQSATVKNGLIYAIRETTSLAGVVESKDIVEVNAAGALTVKISNGGLFRVTMGLAGNGAVLTASNVTRNNVTYPAYNVTLENSSNVFPATVRGFANFGTTTPIQFGAFTTPLLSAGVFTNPTGISVRSGVANGSFYLVNGVEDATSTFAGPWPVRFSEIGLNVESTANVVKDLTYNSPNRFFFNNASVYGNLLWSGPMDVAFSDDGIYAAVNVAGVASVSKYHFTSPSVTSQPAVIPGGLSAVDQTIDLVGDKFGYNDVFYFNGVACATMVVSDTTLRVVIPASAIGVKGHYPVSLTYAFENGTTGTLNLGTLEVGPRPVLSVASLTPNPLHGGIALAFTVSLSEPAAFPGQTVTVTNMNPAVTLPGTVAFATGETTKTFDVVPNYVTMDTVGDVTTSLDSVTQTTSLTVLSHKVASVAVSPSMVIGGNSATGTVTISSPAAPGGYVVALSSSNPDIAVPVEVTVPDGATTASFPVDFAVVANDGAGVITASLNGSSQMAAVNVKAANMTTLGLSTASIAGGNPITGTINIDGKAPTGGLVVTLSSSNAKVVVPATVTIAAGQMGATFTATTVSTAVNVPVTVTASARGVVLSQGVTITAPVVVSVASNPASITGSNTGVATVTLDGPAPTGWAVSVMSDNPVLGFGLVAGVPVLTKTVTIPTGARSATTGINTVYVTADTVVNVTASRAGVSAATMVNVLPPAPLSIIATPGTVRGGVNTSVKVTLTCKAPVGGLVVALSSNRSEVVMPATVSVAAGLTSATVSVPTLVVSSTVTAVMSAIANGYTRTSTMSVTPSLPASIAFAPSSVVGGTNGSGKVTLTGAAGPDGTVVTLVSSSPKVVVPATVTVPAGTTSVSFVAITSTVPVNISATVRATALAVTVTGTLTVQAPKPTVLAYNPTSITGGKTATGTVTLSGKSPAGGTEVTLNADNGILTIPATVVVPEGASTVTFPVSTLVVDTNVVVTTTATANLTTVTKTVTVLSPVLTTLSLVSSINGGLSTSGKVTLSGAAPAGGITVGLVSNNAAVTVPASVVVLEGALSANFTATTNAVDVDEVGSVIASHGTVSKSVVIKVKTALVTSITVSPASVKGLGTLNFRVSLVSAAGPSGRVVTLSSANPAVNLPATVTVPSGATFITFTASTNSVAVSTSGLVTATTGAVSKTVNVTVTP